MAWKLCWNSWKSKRKFPSRQDFSYFQCDQHEDAKCARGTPISFDKKKVKLGERELTANCREEKSAKCRINEYGAPQSHTRSTNVLH